MIIIIPKGCYAIGDATIKRLSVYFLAGPARGGGDWQAATCDALMRFSPTDFVVASPRRWTTEHRLAKYFANNPSCGETARQLDWEHWFLDIAGRGENGGCILFWLGTEDATHPHPGPEPYAMDTRGELGEWRMRMKYERARVVLGAEDGFYGLSQIKRNFARVMEREVPFYTSIEKTARAAVQRYGKKV